MVRYFLLLIHINLIHDSKEHMLLALLVVKHLVLQKNPFSMESRYLIEMEMVLLLLYFKVCNKG